MSKINLIQQNILGLDGGAYQKLMDAYLYKKFQYQNIEPLGSQTGTNKVTKGIPDSYVKLENEKYVLIMYGTVESTSYGKIKSDIEACLDADKLDIELCEIEEIVCCYTSTNIHIEQQQELEKSVPGVKVVLVSLGTVSHDLLFKYPTIALEYLNIQIDTEQIFEVDDFIARHDRNGINAPMNMNFLKRENEKRVLVSRLEESNVVLVSGNSGVGKTRLVLEVLREHSLNKNIKVLCIKNNGQVLYNDLKYHISDLGEYILFVDDANQITNLEHILNYVDTAPDGIKVKVIMTVREYAKEKIKAVLDSKVNYVEEEIKRLEDSVIEEILVSNLNIKNTKYLERIVKISKGNPRLAVLAGMVALKEGAKIIYNAVDIFKVYYGNIIEKEILDKKKIVVAFLIALLGPFEYRKSEIAVKILHNYGVEENDFYEICYELNKFEILDLYMDKVVKITDQSMGDYLLYYVIIQKKYIKLTEIISNLFNKNRNKLMYALNTIGSLFNSKETFKYIESQVNEVWDNIQTEEESFEYLKAFYLLNEEKSLFYIKNSIEKLPTQNAIIESKDLEGNYKNISSELISILGGFKDSDNYEIALELSISYLKKQPNKGRDIYLLFSEVWGYDHESYKSEYIRELKNIEYLWKSSNEGEDFNVSIVLLKIAEYYLGFQFNRTESNGSGSIKVIRFDLYECRGLETLREKIWWILGSLYNKGLYKEQIDKILLNYNSYLVTEKEKKGLYITDLNSMKCYLFGEINIPNFNQCRILKKMNKLNSALGLGVEEVLEKYKKNEKFLICDVLMTCDRDNLHWKEVEEKRKENIHSMIREYKKNDFINLFNVCTTFINDTENNEIYKIIDGLDLIFISLKDDVEMYVKAIEVYLKYDKCQSYYIDNKVAILINLIGIERTEAIICNTEYKNKNKWLYAFLFSIPREERNLKNVVLLRKVFEEELSKESPIIPGIESLLLYSNIDVNLISELAEMLDKSSFKDKAYAIQNFLGYSIDEKESAIILKQFEKNIYVLENLYLEAIEKNIDYSGNIFINLVHFDIDFLEQFIEKAMKYGEKNYHVTKLKRLWSLQNYDEVIKSFFEKVILTETYIYRNDFLFENIFCNKNTTEEIKNKKLSWLKGQIKNVATEVRKLNLIFRIILSYFEENALEFILYFLEINKDLKVFEKIKITSIYTSVSGSEIPLIEKDILFLENLLKNLKGIDYLEHKVYLKKELEEFEVYKQSMLLSEYIDEGSF